ncbi:MAG TPA: RsmB/NOP family class I SAM-dependent RNA methyltransferase [Candidatus Didemnitutus sp.]|nr:RsmB/NOP family class I SAM-dependent RNA methyltransferase [Candidatus Didemnitutus sp.]
MKRDVKPGFENHSREARKGGSDPTPDASAREKDPRNGWIEAVRLTERWRRRRERVDSLLEQLTSGLVGRERARAQHLFYGVVRWQSRIEAAMSGLFSRPPRPRLRALLDVMGFELWEADGERAQVVHHAVEQAKKLTSAAEARLVNAVGRTMASRLAENPDELAERWAHPRWLVERWTGEFGPDVTSKLLEWNQTPAAVTLRWRDRTSGPPDFLRPAAWPAFYSVEPGHWDQIRELAERGAVYLQDPSTRLAPEMLRPGPGEMILDACAAPGGKSLLIADALAEGPSGKLVAIDTPGPRLDRLKANLAKAPSGVNVALLPADLLTVNAVFFRKCNLPESYDAVLLDAPCSNTGVMRHRVDVKWRLQPDDFARHAAQQFKLLRAAARWVRPGGRLVYSTCSIETEENESVIRRFFAAAPEWKLSEHRLAYPWIDGHDGAGVFLLTRGTK